MSLSLPLPAQLENSLPVSGPGLGSGSGPGCHGHVLPDRSDHPPEKSINETLIVAGNFVKAFLLILPPPPPLPSETPL